MKNTTVIKRLFKGQSRVVATLGVSLGFSLIQVVGSLMIPVLAGQAIDAITEEGVDFAALRTPLSGIVLCAVSAGIFGWIASALHNRAAYETVRNLRECAFSRLQQMRAATLDAHPHGDIVSRVINDAEQLADGLILGFSQLFTGVLTAVITLVFMVKISLVVALAVVVLTPLSLFTAKFIAGKTYRLFRRQSETRGRQTALIGEMIGHQKTLRVLGYEDRAVCRFEEVNEQLRRDSVKAVFSSSLTNPVTRFINNIIYAVVGLMGAWLALNGRITVGAFVSFLAYATQYTKPFNEISGVMTELQNAFACADRVLELIDQPIETEDPAAPPFPDRVGEMRMEKVSFSYEPGNPVLRNFSFTAKAGQKIAIVGPTGCGKTTLIHLLMRFYEPTSGRLLADGEDLRLFTKESLRRHFGMVLQETWVMNGTVRENIAFGKPDASEEEIIVAAKAARADGFIRRLPNGYDTVIGNNDGLSEGERQLLCIARVMLLKPPMLILDEATSSIDARTEINVQKAFSRLMEGRLSFVVAHRLSTVRDADCILVMKDGRVFEQGTHEQLLTADGFYAKLYQSRLAGGGL